MIKTKVLSIVNELSMKVESTDWLNDQAFLLNALSNTKPLFFGDNLRSWGFRFDNRSNRIKDYSA